MKRLFKGGSVFSQGGFSTLDILIEDGRFSQIAPDIDAPDAQTVSLDGLYVFPCLIDVHTHLREPGFVYKEDIASATAAAARGGFTSICAMPNLDPVPDCEQNLALELDAIAKSAVVRVYPYAAITVGEQGKQLTDFAALAPKTVAFSDDGHGVENAAIMEAAMRSAVKNDALIAAHCEFSRLVTPGGCVHDGKFAADNSLPAISSESEWKMIERDLELAEKTGCRYHVCHVSTLRGVELIRRAKKKGVDVTCETAPHYLLLTDADLRDEGRFKMNPPVRSEFDRLALIEGLIDGTVDMIATDHAPHSEQEKSGGLRNAKMGVSGLETAFAVLFTGLVTNGFITLEHLIWLMHGAPAGRFGIGSVIARGEPADFTAFDLTHPYVIDSAQFLSKGKSTPFEGVKVLGRCKHTVVGGKTVWSEEL